MFNARCLLVTLKSYVHKTVRVIFKMTQFDPKLSTNIIFFIISEYFNEILWVSLACFCLLVFAILSHENVHRFEIILGWQSITVGFFFLSQPERKVLNSKIETKHYKDFLWIMTVKTPLKTDDFVNLSLKSSPEQKLYRFENWNFPPGLA